MRNTKRNEHLERAADCCRCQHNDYLAGGRCGRHSQQQRVQLVDQIGRWKLSPNFGERGVQFVVRSTVTSIVFGVVASYMPQTSQNVFFSLLFFNTNTHLMQDAMVLSAQAFNAVTKAVTGATATRATPAAPTAAAKPCGAASSCAFSK